MNQQEYMEKLILEEYKEQLERDRDQFMFSLEKLKESSKEWEAKICNIDNKLKSIANTINRLK